MIIYNNRYQQQLVYFYFKVKQTTSGLQIAKSIACLTFIRLFSNNINIIHQSNNMGTHPKIYNCLHFPNLLCFVIASLCFLMSKSFQFTSLRITASTLVINQISSYQITMIRQLSGSATSTPWNTQAVPSGSKISVIFPSEYTLTGSETCTYLLINSTPSTSFTCNIITSTRTIQFQGAITANTFISDVILEIGNILNPSPAIFTSPFQGIIGADTSAVDSAASLALQPGALQSLSLSFEPATVNTTGSLIVNLVTKNTIPAGGSVYVVFPQTLKWSKQASNNHRLPITTTMSCSALVNAKFTITCSGDSATATVIATNIFDTQISSGTEIQFTINQIFSPPTTEPIDSLTVTTYSSSPSSSSNYKVDTISSTISGLIAHNITSALTLSTSGTPIINSGIGMIFTWTLPDTITKNDYFEVEFPNVGKFNLITIIPNQLSLTNFAYNSTSRVLKAYQTSTASDKYISQTVGFNALTYTAPSSVQTTPPFILRVMNNGYLKMQGQGTITTLPKQYLSTVSTISTTVNAQTSYTVSFQLSDPLSSSGYMILTIPSQLTLKGIYTITITGPSISSSPTITMDIDNDGKTFFTLKNLNSSTATIPEQSISITINGLIQPGSVKNISPFIVKIYYSSANDVVAEARNTNAITTTPGNIASMTVGLSSGKNSEVSVIYTFNVGIANQIPIGGIITITLPSQVVIESGGACTINTVSLAATSCLISGQTIKFTTSVKLQKSTIVALTYSKLTNPKSTKPVYISDIFTTNSLLQKIDILPSTLKPLIQTSLPSDIPSVTMIRGNKQNSKAAIYSFNVTQTYAIIQSQISLKITFPTAITIKQNQLVCTNNGVAVSCVYSAHYVKMTFTAVSTDNFIYQISITKGIYNPISMEPTTSISIQSFGKSSSLQYAYSHITSGLTVTNTFASAFASLLYTYSNRVLSSTTNLLLTFDFSSQQAQVSQTNYFVLTPATSFSVNLNTSLACTSQTAGLSPICTLQQDSQTNKISVKITSASGFPSAFSITFQSFNTPAFIPSDYTSLTSYTSSDYIISSSSNLIKFTTYCTFPCQTCNISTPTKCLSCYASDLTNKIYLHDSSCLASCPSQFYEDTGNLICKQCLDPCYECDVISTNCTYCDLNSTYLYLNITQPNPETATCLSQCPLYMYADVTQIPYLCTSCVDPCLACSDIDVCESCVATYFLYQSSCLQSCPQNTTVPNTNTINGIDICEDCSPICLTCQTSRDLCTSCTNQTALFNGTCVSECPGNKTMVIQNSQCVPCVQKCATCQIQVDNCLTCDTTVAQYKYFYQNDCLSVCPDFYYPNSFSICLKCSDLTSRNCNNCSGPTTCLSCDIGYVFLNNNCLDKTPDGYLNISGIAIPCEGDCQTCSITLTNCTSCKTLNLFGNTCQQTCPDATIPLNQICQSCQFPCQTCQLLTTRCLTCFYSTNTSIPEYYFSNFKCVEAADCPATTYPNETTLICASCIAPCLNCLSESECVSCRTGFFFIEESQSCQNKCPFGSVGVNKICYACSSPCQSCFQSVTQCLTCIPDYFYNPITYQCVLTCPQGTSIANQTSMQCQICQAPCKTCYNTTSTCFSCKTNFYLFGEECFDVCPEGYYGSSGVCQLCQNNCKSCKSATQCLSCPSNLFLYSFQCIKQCPDSHALLPDGSNVCTSCQANIVGCSNCTDTGQCYQCYSPYKYFQSECLDSCPNGYEYNTQIFECVVKNQTNQTLQQNLSSDNVFPMPFTVLTSVCIIAACMSKLQNRYTYLVGLLYSLLGIVETLALAYLGFRYWQLGTDYVLYDSNTWLLILIAGGIIYFLNITSFIIQTPLLLVDKSFQQWISSERGHNKCFFTIVLFISLLINYKFKMIPFTKLFKFYCMSAILTSVGKFRVFNVFSFFGIAAQCLGLYICFVSLFDKTKLQQTQAQTDATITPNFTTNLVMFYAFLDVIVVFILNIILAIAITWKKDNFFEEEQEDGYVTQKKIHLGDEDFSKEALEGEVLDEKFLGNNFGDQSYGALDRGAIQENSLEESFVSQIVQQMKVKQMPKSKIKVYFADDNGESSNPFRKEQIHKEQQIANIFSEINQQDEYHLSQRDPSDDLGVSQTGGSQKFLVVNSPKRSLSPKKIITAFVQSSKVSNLATENQIEDVGKKISQRQLQLDQLKKQIDEKQRLRKQKRKSHKKLKKTIAIQDSSPSQKQAEESIEYEQISIKQTNSMHSATLTNTKKPTTLQNSSGLDNGPQLSQQKAQKTIDDVFPPEKQDIDDEDFMERQLQQSNRSQLAIFSYPNKQLRTCSKQEDNVDNDQDKHKDEDQQNHELQEEPKQQSISKSIYMKKSTIKPSNFDQSRQIYDTLQDGKLQYDIQVKQKTPNEKPQLSIQYQQSLDKELLTQPTKKQKQQKSNQQIKQSQQEIYEYQQESRQYEGGNTKLNFYNSLQSNRELSNDKSVSVEDSNRLRMLQKQKRVEEAKKMEEKKRQKERKKDEEYQQIFENTKKSKGDKQYEIQENQGNDFESLQDSVHKQENQRINERPISAIRKAGLSNNEALVQILEQAQKDKQKYRSRNYSRPLPKEQDTSPANKMFTTSNRNKKLTEQQEEEQRPNQKSRVYLAGLRQVEKDNLKKRTIQNSVRVSHGDSDLQSQRLQPKIKQNRNKSFNTAPFRKYTSKDRSIDEMSFKMQPYQSNYEQLLNPRYNKSGLSQEKSSNIKKRQLPGGISSNRQFTNLNKASLNASQFNNQDSLKNYYNYNLSQSKYNTDEDDLQKYYMKQRLNHSKSKSKGKHQSKDKQLIKQRSLQDTKRYKQLQKIYASKPK